MPRANRYIVSGANYHVTHRCHDRAFLFRFAVDRNAYQAMLRERLQSWPISLLAYVITSNHVHLLVRVKEGGKEALSGFMQSLQGDFAQYYNRRKKREGAFWRDRYHAVMVDSGEYLRPCQVYIDMNMVRAGVVEHPRDWPWSSYRELAGLKKRNRLVNTTELIRVLGPGHHLDRFRVQYMDFIDSQICRRDKQRDPRWTESLAVGSEAFVRRIGPSIPNRVQLAYHQHGEDLACWMVREPAGTYTTNMATENRPISPNMAKFDA